MEFHILFIYTSLWTWAFLVSKIAGSVNSSSVYQQSDVPLLSQKYGEELFMQRFNINSWATYAQFIQSLRGKQQLRYKTSHDRPVLYPEQVTPNKFFDVILKVNGSEPTSKEVRLRIRQENLYLVGYKNANNQWLEFDDFKPTHLITGSTFLGYNSSYIILENKAGQNRSEIFLGKKQLIQAVNDLATSTTTKTRAKGLIIVIQMISESMRFRSISTFLATASKNPPTWVVEQENSWGHISKELLHRDSNSTHKFVPPSAGTGITNEVQAVNAIGMIKYFNFSRISRCNVEANNEGKYPQANPMVEVA